MPDLKTLVFDVLSSRRDGASFGDIVEALEGQGDIAPSSVRQVLKELEDERKVLSFPDSREGPGRPRNVYKVLGENPVEEGAVIIRDVIEEASAFKEDALLRELIQDSTGLLSTLPYDLVKKIYDEAATRLLTEDPIDLFVRFARWLFEQHSNYVNLLKNSKGRAPKSVSEKYERAIEKLERFGEQVFSRMLGVPRRTRDEANNTWKKDCPFNLQIDRRTIDDASSFDEVSLRSHLARVILGKTVLEKVTLSVPAPPLNLGGSDSSMQPIDISVVLPWQTESREINIVTAIGVRYDIFKGAQEIDRFPDPKALAQYERRQAIEEGLLIPPPGTMGFEEEMYGKVKTAAMDLRQYSKDYEMMFVKEPPARIHFRDGRIFPLEHSVSDAIRPGLHGELVRAALKMFRNLVNGVGGEAGSILYCGFVKRPGIQIMAPLFSWFVGFGSGQQDPDKTIYKMTVEEFLFRSLDGDSVVVNRLFSSLQESSPGNTFLSFRLLRLFTSLEDDFIRGFSASTNRDEWHERLGKLSRDFLATDPDGTGVDLLASLFARAAVLEFYSSLPKELDPRFESSVTVPRIELLVPYPDLTISADGVLPIRAKERVYSLRIVEVLAHPGVLEYYPGDELNPFARDSRKGVFLAPKPVVESHLSSKLIAQVYRDDFVELMIKEAKLYWSAIRGQAGGQPSIPS